MTLSCVVIMVACGSGLPEVVDASTSDATMDAASAGPCGPAGECPGNTQCYFAIADGCGAVNGMCFTPHPFSPACKAMSYCDCFGNTVSDCRAPAGYLPTRVAKQGFCLDGGADASTD